MNHQRPDDTDKKKSIYEFLDDVTLRELRVRDSKAQIDLEFLAELDQVLHTLSSGGLSNSVASDLRSAVSGFIGNQIAEEIWDRRGTAQAAASDFSGTPTVVLGYPRKFRQRVLDLAQELPPLFTRLTGVQLTEFALREAVKFELVLQGQVVLSLEERTSSRLVSQQFLESLCHYAPRLLSVQMVNSRLLALRAHRPEIWAGMQKEKITLSAVTRVLRALLAEGLPVFDFGLIAETILVASSAPGELVAEVCSQLRPIFSDRIFAPKLLSRDGRTSAEKRPHPVNECIAPPVSVLVGRGLLGLVGPKQSILERVDSIRRHLARELGWLIPLVRFSDDLSLPRNDFRVLVRGRESAGGTLYTGLLLTLGPDHQLKKLRGVAAKEPVYGQEAVWIDGDQREEAEKLGCMVFTAVSTLGMTLSQVLCRHVGELYSLQSLHDSLQALAKQEACLVGLVEKSPETKLLARQVIARLLEEGVNVQALDLILLTLMENKDQRFSVATLTEMVRVRIFRLQAQAYLNEENEVSVVTLSEHAEGVVERALVEGEEPYLDGSDQTLGVVLKSILDAFKEQVESSAPMILLAPPLLRRPLWEALRTNLPGLKVVTRLELPVSVSVRVAREVGEVPLRVVDAPPVPRPRRGSSRSLPRRLDKRRRV